MKRDPSPLQASFWLTDREKLCLLFVCAILLLGLAARYFHLGSEQPEAYSPCGAGHLGKGDD